MKIVQINAVYQFSSTGRNTKEMHLSFLEKGHNSYVFCTNHQDEERFVYRMGTRLDYAFHALFSRLIGLQGYFSYFSTIKLLKRLDKINPDVVILGNLHANYIHLPLLLSYLAKQDLATLVVLHDCWFFTGHCCHYTEDRCYKWQRECTHCPILHKYNKSLFWDRSQKIFREKYVLFSQIKKLAIIGVSDWITNEARISLLGQAPIIRRIYNWIDLDTFRPFPNDELHKLIDIEGRYVVLGVAQNWSEAKGISLFVSVARRFPDIKVVLVGSMPMGKELTENILSVGPINDIHLLARYYSMADVFLNPSIQETFGKVSAEALACGTPVIANDATANPEIVGDCGYIVHDNNEHDIFTAIMTMRKRDKGYYTESCVERAHMLFNRETNLEEYIRVCEELVK